MDHEEVLRFWFDEIDSSRWWRVDSEFDASIGERFGVVLGQAAAGELSGWRAAPRGRLAEVVVLDQFSRNVFRNTPGAFSQDPMALVLAQEALVHDAPRHLNQSEVEFLLMPFMHSESRLIHERAEQLFRAFASPGSMKFELRHKAIIDRFGRYPHRNTILGRTSTPAEQEFLRQPGSSF